MKLSKILVPLDGSALAETAIPAAVGLAETTGASLMLLRAAEAHGIPGGDATDAQVAVVRQAEQYLEGIQRRIRSSATVDVTTSVWYGNATEAIAEAARFNTVDMVVMTTHGRSGLGRLVLGSVTESVLRHTPIPILVLHPEGAPLLAPRGQSRPVAHGCASGWMSAGRIDS